MRVRVWLDVSKPLRKGFLLRRPKEEDLWVNFRYERLSEFCYACGIISHTVNECKEKRSFDAKNWLFDGRLRAENVVLDTIQYGTKPLPVLVYPEKKLRVNHGDDGGACSSGEGLRVAQAAQNIPKKSLANLERRVDERIMVWREPQEEATLHAETNVVVGLSGKAPREEDPSLSGPIGPVLPIVTPSFKTHLFGEERLSSVFSKALNLKRKLSDCSEEEDEAKKPRRIANGENGITKRARWLLGHLAKGALRAAGAEWAGKGEIVEIDRVGNWGRTGR
ncbi:hypothetical protein RHMOL_Rhmol09G0141500 [Rhododendron molle]|uniref:Uncharacterized protein n=1 Tax=Rhododendron molle TaxID=49168 RepID=A0ACC0MEC9_RHOML|nr:hypothetical protein RHMOL_Rhmol09G0141500 [Rhododendron molle]